jgi:hypothetical protein
MKRVFVPLAFAGALCLAGCANEGPTGEELQEQLRKGVTGEGRLSEDMDRTGDPYVKPREGASLSTE